LHNAVGSPVSTEESDYQRAFCQELSRRNRVSLLIVQDECRRPIAVFQRAFGQSGLAQLFRGPMKDFDYGLESIARRTSGFELCFKVVQFLLKRHRIPSVALLVVSSKSDLISKAFCSVL